MGLCLAGIFIHCGTKWGSPMEKSHINTLINQITTVKGAFVIKFLAQFNIQVILSSS